MAGRSGWVVGWWPDGEVMELFSFPESVEGTEGSVWHLSWLIYPFKHAELYSQLLTISHH